MKRSTGCDLEALETAIRGAALAAGAKVLEGLLDAVGTGRRGQAVRCACGAAMRSAGVRTKQVQTLLGRVSFARSRYRCAHCGNVRYPGDEALSIVETSRSPGVRRQVARLGAKEPFEEVSKDLAEVAGIPLCRKEAERISERVGAAMEDWQENERVRLRLQPPPPPDAPRSLDTLYVEFDGTGVPMVPREVAGRRGKQEDGSARTREAKLGCVFTQHTFDEEGRPIRDRASTTFTGAIEPAARFGRRIYAEAVRRGLFEARRVVVLGDGAEWVKNLASTHFGHGRFIVDYYHAKQHVTELCRALFDHDIKRLNRYRDRWWDLLYEGDIETLTDQARAFLPRDKRAKKEARTQIRYFEKNARHMRYGQFRREGLFIGSGVVEAGCKHVIGHRLKQSGMEWTVRGANDIIALRCATLSNRAQDFWEKDIA